MRARESHRPWDELAPKLEALLALLKADDRKGAIALVRDLVPEYTADNQDDESRRSA